MPYPIDASGHAKPSFQVELNIDLVEGGNDGKVTEAELMQSSTNLGTLVHTVEFSFDYDDHLSPYDTIFGRAAEYCNVTLGHTTPETCATPLALKAESTWLRLLLPRWQEHLSRSGITFTRPFFTSGSGGFFNFEQQFRL